MTIFNHPKLGVVIDHGEQQELRERTVEDALTELHGEIGQLSFVHGAMLALVEVAKKTLSPVLAPEAVDPQSTPTTPSDPAPPPSPVPVIALIDTCRDGLAGRRAEIAQAMDMVFNILKRVRL